jgi:hypothetical protein
MPTIIAAIQALHAAARQGANEAPARGLLQSVDNLAFIHAIH